MAPRKFVACYCFSSINSSAQLFSRLLCDEQANYVDEFSARSRNFFSKKLKLDITASCVNHSTYCRPVNRYRLIEKLLSYAFRTRAARSIVHESDLLRRT